MKEHKRTVILTALVCLLPIIAGLILYPKVPAQIATHWDADGNPDGWSSRLLGLIVFPGILLVIDLLMPLLLKIDPKYRNMNPKTVALVMWIIPAVSLLASGITLAAALGTDVPVSVVVPMFLGLCLVIIGNFLPKMAQSYTVGIKVPWTLDSEENWNRTHRMAGFLWVVIGVLVIICSLFPYKGVTLPVLMLIAVLIPVIYSYLLYRKGI